MAACRATTSQGRLPIRLARVRPALLEGRAAHAAAASASSADMYRKRAQPGSWSITGEKRGAFRARSIELRRHGQARAPLAGSALLGKLQAHAESRALRAPRSRAFAADGMSKTCTTCRFRGINEFDANGFHAHNCGEQPLPPYGSCLLGSVNLTRFVKNAFTDFAEFDWNEYREVVKVFTRMLDNVVRDQRPAARAAARRDHAQAPPRHGLPRARQHHHLPRHEVRPPRIRCKFTEDVSREMAVAGWEAALDLAQGEGPGADHERGVHGHRRDAAQASGDGEGRLEGRRPDPRPHPARALQPLHAARRRDRAVARATSSPRSARASRTTPPSRPPARSRCRWPTMPATASSRRSRITTSATSSAPARRPRRKMMSSHSSCWPIASSSIRVRCRTRNDHRPNSCRLFHDGG